MIWFQFILCFAAILFSGTKLSRYGDVLAEKTGLGRTWIGVVIIAGVTSLPELVTGLSSVAIFSLPDIAVGNVLGACMMNMLLLGILSFMAGLSVQHGGLQKGHALTAAFGIVMLALAAAPLTHAIHIPVVGWIGLQSFLMIAMYFVAMKMIFAYEQKRIEECLSKGTMETFYHHISLRRAILIFGAHSVVIIAAAAYLPRVGEIIAAQTGLGETFIGNVLIALSTTLPEIVVSFSAYRIGALDMAAGNLYGSVLINLFILAVDDVFYRNGVLLLDASTQNVASVLACIVMIGLSVIGLITRSAHRAFFIAWDALGMAAVYIAVIFILLAA